MIFFSKKSNTFRLAGGRQILDLELQIGLRDKKWSISELRWSCGTIRSIASV